MDKNEETKKKIIDYLASHIKMTLATVTPEGKPIAHTVVYANEGATVYFRSRDFRRKNKNILNNPAVAYCVDEYPGDDWGLLQGVQMEGKAVELTESAEIKHATELYLKKFPFVDEFVPRDTPELRVIKVEPVEGYYLNYPQEFGLRERVKF